jgi:hypothetical protein
MLSVVEHTFSSVRHLSERERLLVGHKAKVVVFVQTEEILCTVEQVESLVQFRAQPVENKKALLVTM